MIARPFCLSTHGRISRASLAAGLAFAGLSLAACKKPAPPPKPKVPVAVTPVRRTAVPYVVTATGVVEPLQTVAVEAQVGGILERVNFSEGQDVRAGQILFQIDPRPYTAALRQAEAQLARDAAQAKNAQRDAERYANLVQKDYVTKSQADQAQATAAAQSATVAADQAAVDKARLDVANTTVRAPISGRTGSLLVRQGNLVKANSAPPLVVINQIQPILVRFSIPQSQFPDVQRYSAGKRALKVQVIPSEGNGIPSEGALSFVDNAVDSATGTVLLKGRFDNMRGTLWPGQFVNVALQLAVDSAALVVPSQAVLTGQNGTYLFTVDAQGNAKQHPVVTGATMDSLVVIREGVTDGAQVIVDGQSRLVPGAKVTIKTPGAKGNGKGGGGKGGSAVADTNSNKQQRQAS